MSMVYEQCDPFSVVSTQTMREATMAGIHPAGVSVWIGARGQVGYTQDLRQSGGIFTSSKAGGADQLPVIHNLGATTIAVGPVVLYVVFAHNERLAFYSRTIDEIFPELLPLDEGRAFAWPLAPMR